MKYVIGETVFGATILETNGAQTLEKLRFRIRYACCGQAKWITYKGMETRRRQRVTLCLACAQKKKTESSSATRYDYGITQPTWPVPRGVDNE